MPECRVCNRVRDACSGFLDKSQLRKLRLRTMRAGVRFRSLPSIDRAVVDLTIMHAEVFRVSLRCLRCLRFCCGERSSGGRRSTLVE